MTRTSSILRSVSIIFKNPISSKWEPVFIFLLVLVSIMGISIIDTISNPSNTVSQLAGPAIGGVIAVFAGYLFTKWGEKEKERRRKQFLASVFLFELRKIQNFIDGIEKLNIKNSDFLITRPPVIEGGITRRDERPEWDEYKQQALLTYFHDNDYIRVTESAPLISKKSPFEIFAQEIYVFQDSYLIFKLLKIDSLLNEANSCLLDFHKIRGPSDGHLELFNFMTKIQKLKPEIDSILCERKLDLIENGSLKIDTEMDEAKKNKIKQ